MTQFAADDFAYIAAKLREIAEQDAAAKGLSDMDAANEPAREWLVCVMCNHKWHGIESTDNCPACHVKNPTIPF